MDAVREEDWNTAARELQTAVEVNPGDQYAWKFLGFSLERLGRREDALEAYGTAFELTNGSPSLAGLMAKLSLDLGEFEDALALSRVDRDGERHWSQRVIELRALAGLEQLPEALQVADAMLLSAPEDSAVLFLRGQLRAELQLWERAETDFERVLALSPDHAEALRELGVLVMSRGDFDRARQVYEQLLRVAPEDPVAIRNLQLLPPPTDG
jgi:Flp pilus assembly protein TadD